MSDSDDEDIPQLSSHALAALQEFYAEQKQQSDPGRDDKYNIGIIEENWVSKCIPHPSKTMGAMPIPYLSTPVGPALSLYPTSYQCLSHLPLRSW